MLIGHGIKSLRLKNDCELNLTRKLGWMYEVMATNNCRGTWWLRGRIFARAN